MDETDEGSLEPFYCHNTLPEPASKRFSSFFFHKYLVGTPYITINTFLANFTALKQHFLIFEIFNTFEYQKVDQHLQAGLPVHYLGFFVAFQTNKQQLKKQS